MLKFNRNNSFNNKNSSSKVSDKSRGGSIIFGAIWTAFSSIFVCAGLYIAYSSFKESRWDEKDCKVEALEVKSNPSRDKAFEPIIKFSYLVGTKNYYGNEIQKGQKFIEDYSKVEELVHLHKTKGINKCYVNPADPAEAVLVKKGISVAFFGLGFALFGSFFVCIGLSLIFSSRKSKKSDGRKIKSPNKELAFMIPFFGVFAIVGTVAFVHFVNKALDARDIKSWEEAPARVIWSRVKSVRGDDSTTYKPEIFYKYKFKGKNFKSSTYEVFSSSSSGRSKKQLIVDQYKKGRKFDCFVDPKRPWRAVIKSDVGLSWLWMLFPLPFMAVGYGGIFCMLKTKKKGKRALRSNGRVAATISGDQPEPDLTTKEFSSGKARFYWIIGSIAIALFWNGIVSVFVKDLYKSWVSGDVDWFTTLFMIPFILIGLALILHIFYRILALFSASARVSITPGFIEFDKNVKINWEITKGKEKVQALRIYLIGEEYSRTGSQKNKSMSGYVFYEEELCNITETYNMEKGGVTVNLSSQQQNIMHTFEADINGNGIKWWIWIEGKVAFLPNLSDLHEVEVIAKRRT